MKSYIYLSLTALLALSPMSRAQGQHAIAEKLSESTRMFIDEREGRIVLPRFHKTMHLAPRRPIAEAEWRGGQRMVSAFVAIRQADMEAIRSRGVVVEKVFDDLLTVLVPADSIESLAGLDCVRSVEVAEVVETQTDQARIVTHTADVQQLTAEAQAMGLTSSYTGRDVIFGIVDRGFDFHHPSFCDAEGGSRIVRAYTLKPGSSSALIVHSTKADIAMLTCDVADYSHGTHAASIGAGSSLMVEGSEVRVTDRHAQANYGGMAPEADIVVAGLSTLYSTAIANAVADICEYADSVGKPCVISLSLGTQNGPHDGTSSLAHVLSRYASRNHIILIATCNDAGRSYRAREVYHTSQGGGLYATGTSTKARPWLVNLQHASESATGNVILEAPTFCAYARTVGVELTLRFHVVNVSTGAIVYSSREYTSSTSFDVTENDELGAYFRSDYSSKNAYGDYGKVRISRSRNVDTNKYFWQVYLPQMKSRSTTTSGGITSSTYALCVAIYPTKSGTSVTIDAWDRSSCWFGTDLELSNPSAYNYAKGCDDSSVGDYTIVPGVITVGSYVSKNQCSDYTGKAMDLASRYPLVGGHAPLSGWQGEGCGPLGTAAPTISAPGATIVSAVSRYDSNYTKSDFSGAVTARINTSTTYPLANMSGTSMATPCAAGIVALWLQAAGERGWALSPDDVMEIMDETSVRDDYTEGTLGDGPRTFGGHGKIDALAGIRHILEHMCLMGDVNRDGEITIADVTALVNIILGKDEAHVYDHQAAEINGDGIVSIADVTALVNRILGARPKSINRHAAFASMAERSIVVRQRDFSGSRL